MKTKRILIEVGYSDEAELGFIKRAIGNLSRCYQLSVVREVDALPVRVASEDRPAITQPVKVLT